LTISNLNTYPCSTTSCSKKAYITIGYGDYLMTRSPDKIICNYIRDCLTRKAAKSLPIAIRAILYAICSWSNLASDKPSPWCGKPIFTTRICTKCVVGRFYIKNFLMSTKNVDLIGNDIV